MSFSEYNGVMKTLLDLTGEFAVLNHAKNRCHGTLPPELEKRWSELKRFYDSLMSHNGVHRRAATHAFTVPDIRQKVPVRMCLRVPVEMDIFFDHYGEYHTARIMNLSCGGALLSADTVLDPGSRLTLYLIKSGRDQVPFVKTDSEVVWCREQKIITPELPDKMGIRFIELPEPILAELESFVIETLERQLSAVDPRTLDPVFVSSEQLVL
jgi:hypothetical protein